MRVSADMESIIGNGGFQFKETVISGNPLDERGELRRCRDAGGTQKRTRSVWTSS